MVSITYLDKSKKGSLAVHFTSRLASRVVDLTDNIRLFMVDGRDKPSGFLLRDINGLLKDLPNYIGKIKGPIPLGTIMFAYRGSLETQTQREIFDDLAKTVQKKGLVLDAAR